MLYPVQPGPLQPKWCRFPDLLLHTHRDVTGASDTVSTRRAIVRGELGCRKKTLGRTQKSVVLDPGASTPRIRHVQAFKSSPPLLAESGHF